MKWADYCITKLSLTESGLIDSILFYKDLGESLNSEALEKNRNWMVQQVEIGKTFCSIKRNDLGKWNKIGDLSYDGKIFSWFIVPKNITRRKTFVSYYHHDDQSYREKYENLFEDLIVSKSVEKDDIDSDNSDEYIKQLIQKDYLSDTTVLVVLVGPKTKCRKHVDWEISGAISSRVGGNSGLIGIVLPSHPDYGDGKKYNPDNLPKRLAANLESGYAKLYDWTDDRVKMQQYIENAFNGKSETEKIRNKSIPQMDKDTCV
jgi:hypothetical protein